MDLSLQQPSVMQHAFGTQPRVEISRSTFNRNHGWKGCVDAGILYPVFFDETVPGDTFVCNLSSIMRMNTLLYPIMDNIYVDFHFFAIPNRLVWENWEKFMGAQENPGDSTNYLCPVVTTPSGGHAEGSMADMFGLPTNQDDVDPNAFLFRCYNLVWNNWYRSEYLQDSVTVNTDDGPDPESDYTLLRRNKRFDYFTQALPWPCKDNQEVTLPLGDEAMVYGKDSNAMLYNTSLATQVWPSNRMTQSSSNRTVLTSDGSTSEQGWNIATKGSVTDTMVYADLSGATASTINQIREAFQLQRMLERDARAGNRYCEVIMSHFNVLDPQHAILQRPEYLGGGTSQINITPIAQTSESGTTKQGNLAAVGTQESGNISFQKSFTEHCHVLGLMSIRADLNYQQGKNRMWSRQTRDDFYWPSYAHLGEQEVTNGELYWQGTSADAETFGFVPRYDEMRYKPSVITGALRSTAATPLDQRHLAQEFTSLPTLGPDFIEEDPPIDRCIAVTSEPQFTADLYFSLQCTRPMPMFGQPGMIDHL
jgi:hypothetical protein